MRRTANVSCDTNIRFVSNLIPKNFKIFEFQKNVIIMSFGIKKRCSWKGQFAKNEKFESLKWNWNEWSWLESSSRSWKFFDNLIPHENFPTSIGTFQLKWKLQTFQLKTFQLFVFFNCSFQLDVFRFKLKKKTENYIVACVQNRPVFDAYDNNFETISPSWEKSLVPTVPEIFLFPFQNNLWSSLIVGDIAPRSVCKISHRVQM